jgi:hydroxymethylpyrimidine pyrophosphatase-like HAD family hydrolase
VVEATGHTGLAICANGAVLYDLHREQVVESFPLTVEVVRDIVGRLREALPDVGFALESMRGFAHEPAYHPEVADPEATVQTVDELLAEELTDDAAPVKLLARHGTLDPDTLLAKAREVIGDVAELTHSSTSGLLEVSAAGISKATTLARVCAERGIPAAEVVAFGDMPNDLPMLAWAGQAWAMGNAHPDVLAAVDQHTAANDADGVAIVLEKLFA